MKLHNSSVQWQLDSDDEAERDIAFQLSESDQQEEEEESKEISPPFVMSLAMYRSI
jgi:hypothetical protein